MKTAKLFLIIFSFTPAMVMAQVNRAGNETQEMNPTSVDQDFVVPNEVKTDFETRYPESEVTNLNADRDKYSIEYKNGGKNYVSYYDHSNNWVETHQKMNYKDLPSSAKNTFMGTQYKDYRVDNVNRIENKNGKEFYQLSIQDAGTSRNLYFDTDGALIDEMNNESPDSNRDLSPGKPGSSGVGERNRILNEPNQIESPVDRTRSR